MSGRDGGARLPARSVEWGLAGALLVTAAAQHPNKMFDRVRRLDPIGILIPNWRFFAPEALPARGRAFPGRSRPLCAYPLEAHYKGQGDPQEIGSFECRPPSP